MEWCLKSWTYETMQNKINIKKKDGNAILEENTINYGLQQWPIMFSFSFSFFFVISFFLITRFFFPFDPFILNWYTIGLNDLFWLAWYGVLAMSIKSFDIGLMLDLTK